MKLSKETEQLIVELYQEGEKAHEIQKALGIAGNVMYGVLRKHGVELRRPAASEARQNSKASRKGAKTKRCPVCKASNNPANAKFCCMCGADIRSETDIVLEKLDKAMTTCIKLLPANATDEVLDAMRQAKLQIERAAK
jgi:uncharacterized paraquat-inducible protein A